MNHFGQDGPLGEANPEELADGGSLLLVEGSSSASTQVKFSLKDAAFPGRHTTISLVQTSQLLKHLLLKQGGEEKEVTRGPEGRKDGGKRDTWNRTEVYVIVRSGAQWEEEEPKQNLHMRGADGNPVSVKGLVQKHAIPLAFVF